MKENWWQGLTKIGMRPGMERTADLLRRLGNPQLRYPIVHVAGTNGKGSTATLITAALMSQGYRVGLTTSPDLGQINERVMINLEPLDPQAWNRLGDQVEAAGSQMTDIPTFFEAVTALAFLAFAEHAVDVAVVEVGLGGRLDATNVIPSPMLTVITPIAFDHMDRLGNTIEQIASEKAGVIKNGSRVVIARQPYPAAKDVLLEKSKQMGVEFFEAELSPECDSAGVWWSDSEAGAMRVPLLGAYQMENVATARAALSVLQKLGWISDWEALRKSWATVKWPGRFQVVSHNPLWVIDGAHNLHGVMGLVNTLSREPWNRYRWHVIFAVLKDKPGSAMLEALLPFAARVTLTQVPGDRGINPLPLFERYGSTVPMVVIDDPLDAVRYARTGRGGPQDAVLVCGSLALLSYLNQHRVFLPQAANVVEQ
ncbi:MAG: bifunctional folylpolyglutamate synthase/dihydrofolate synthase [Firmicutes bacterium]|nr:bifunctional folylpolyglutamate synthase/dihydrofolate synthase [Bacillota bacterium]